MRGVQVVRTQLRLILGATASAAALLVLGAGAVAATSDYTLPFYDPKVTLSYGMDRDPRLNVQLDWTGKTWWDGSPHPGRVYDNHSGLDYPMTLHSPVAAARDGVVVDVEGGYGTQQFGDFGNFVRVEHSDGRQTLYYHLASAASGGISVGVGASVPAGKQIGESGCSGICYGPHLHFELLVPQKKNLISSDPMFNRSWTTWPGRVPFLAAYVRESNAGTEVIRRGQTVTHWVDFRNTGGRTLDAVRLPGADRSCDMEPGGPCLCVPRVGLAVQLDGDVCGAVQRSSGWNRPLHLRPPGWTRAGQLPRDVRPVRARVAMVRPRSTGRLLRAHHRQQLLAMSVARCWVLVGILALAAGCGGPQPTAGIPSRTPVSPAPSPVMSATARPTYRASPSVSFPPTFPFPMVSPRPRHPPATPRT